MVTVLKIGGSVLAGSHGHRRAAACVAEPDGSTLDLLWSTGDIRSAALFVLQLHALGVRATALNVHQAGLVKDVPGYFSRDPHVHADAQRLPILDFARALAMADDGCALVQRHALEAASRERLPLVVRAIDGEGATVIN